MRTTGSGRLTRVLRLVGVLAAAHLVATLTLGGLAFATQGISRLSRHLNTVGTGASSLRVSRFAMFSGRCCPRALAAEDTLEERVAGEGTARRGTNQSRPFRW